VPRIFDFGGREVDRAITVAGLRALKGSGRHAVQVTAETAQEAAAAEAAGIEMVVCRASNVARVREGAKRIFVTASLGFATAISKEEILRTAIEAVTGGADAVLTSRGLETVRMLADEQLPVVGHLGFVPRKSTWVGGVRAFGKTADEAMQLWERFRRLEEAGAFAVEAEVVPAPVLAEINARTGLVMISLGSGPSAEVIFLFTSDVCGESTRLPRHARAYCNLARLHKRIQKERTAALRAFRADVEEGGYPAAQETAGIAESELQAFRQTLERGS
jgi:3-methyl-2-oxobutanoate hydroxymethyltransferase